MDDDYCFSAPSLFGPVRAAVAETKKPKKRKSYAYHEEDCELEIAHRAKVIKLLGLRRIIESKEEDREEFMRTCLGGHSENWKEPFNGVRLTVETQSPGNSREEICDCPYWEHEGKIF